MIAEPEKCLVRSGHYFLDSVEIWVTPIQNESMPNELLYKVIGDSQRRRETSRPALNHWKLNVNDNGGTKLGWKYHYVDGSNYEDLNNRRNFAPEKHSCHWIILEAMSGFHVTITQVLYCKINGWCKYNPIARSKTKKLCPKMAHSPRITFNGFDNFNKNFKNFRKSDDFHDGFLNVAFSKKPSPQMENSKSSSIENIEIMLSFTKFKEQL